MAKMTGSMSAACASGPIPTPTRRRCGDFSFGEAMSERAAEQRNPPAIRNIEGQPDAAQPGGQLNEGAQRLRLPVVSCVDHTPNQYLRAACKRDQRAGDENCQNAR
eukprot:scaffold260599_cov32-Tisochrysis_lutea.AAC.5